MKNPAYKHLIPKPVRVAEGEGVFSLTPSTRISVQAGQPGALQAGQYLADLLRSLTGLALPVEENVKAVEPGCICFTSQGASSAGGEEGYLLEVAQQQVVIRAQSFSGYFYGCQTFRQLLPAAQGPWQIPAVRIQDYPRFAWRGVMLDVARSFFPPAEVKRLIDLFASYKLNRLHLHLSDDQGWRIMINSWPKLALHGGSGAVEGGRSGYYSQEEFRDLAAYAHSRGMLVVPEIDMPGHTTAALASYPELNRGGAAPQLYTGRKVGFSTLAAELEITYQFVADVLGELAQLTPGPYLHVGGDEAHSTTAEEYRLFLERVHAIVAGTGKRLIGWDEIIQAGLQPTDLVQIWRKDTQPREAVRQGAQVIMSPCQHAYLDMKYTPETELGQDWAAIIEVKDAYLWDPVTVYPGIKEADVAGVEAPLWTETIYTLRAAEYMYFPRLLGIAEMGWSPREGRSWEEYRLRLAAHGPRLAAQNVHFYHSPQVPWQEG